MTTAVVTVGPEATLKEAATLLAENGISGLPVVDDEGIVVGIFSETAQLLGPNEVGEVCETETVASKERLQCVAPSD